jgi:hypothetical protein
MAGMVINNDNLALFSSCDIQWHAHVQDTRKSTSTFSETEAKLF